MKKNVLFIGLFILSSLCIYGQNNWINDTVFTIDKQIPTYLNLSNESIQRENVGIKEKNVMLNRILNLNSESSAVLKDTLTDIAGGFHESYVEYYKGIEVEGTRCTIHYGKEGKALNVNGNFRTIENISVAPKIDEKNALKNVISFIRASKYSWEENSGTTDSPKGKLMIYIKDNIPYLVYKFMIECIEPKREEFAVYICALDGKIIDKRIALYDVSTTVNTLYSGERPIETQYYSGSYILRDYTRGNGVETNFAFFFDFISPDNTWSGLTGIDRAGLDAHWGAEATYDYYNNKFGRNSYDNNGAALVSNVNVPYHNASWSQTHHSVIYGFYDVNNTIPLVPLDVVAHEFTHAITYSTSGLFYQGESGALNEGMSDVFAVCIENEEKPNNGYKIWQIGEDVALIRDLGNPNCKYYNGTGWVNASDSTDYGGVHTNSGVFCYWFYILATGCNGINEGGINLPVTGIGLNKAINICYYMNTVYLTPTSDYEDAARYSYLAADALGYGEDVKNQINRAWVNVGVELPRYYIVGDSEPCNSSLYYVENLPNGYTVDWSSSLEVESLMILSPFNTNECTISNMGTIIFDTDLYAHIKNNSGVVVKTVAKNIRNTFDLTFSQQGTTYNGINYGSIPWSSILSCSTIAVNPVCFVYLKSSLFEGMTISHSGAILNSWLKMGDTIKLSFSYSSSVQNLLITGSNGCKMIRLIVRAHPESEIPIPQLMASPTLEGINLALKMVYEDASICQLYLLTSPEWDVNIYNATSGEKVYSNHLSCKETFINTTGWSRDAYVIKAIVNGIETSCKVFVK